MIEHPSYWIDPVFCRCGNEISPHEESCSECRMDHDGERGLSQSEEDDL